MEEEPTKITKEHLAGLELIMNELCLTGADYIKLKDMIRQSRGGQGRMTCNCNSGKCDQWYLASDEVDYTCKAVHGK